MNAPDDFRPSWLVPGAKVQLISGPPIWTVHKIVDAGEVDGVYFDQVYLIPPDADESFACCWDVIKFLSLWEFVPTDRYNREDPL